MAISRQLLGNRLNEINFRNPFYDKSKEQQDIEDEVNRRVKAASSSHPVMSDELKDYVNSLDIRSLKSVANDIIIISKIIDLYNKCSKVGGPGGQQAWESGIINIYNDHS